MKKKIKFWIGDIVKLPCGFLAVVSQDSRNGENISVDFLENIDNAELKNCFNSWYKNEKTEDTLTLVERGPAAKHREKLFGEKKNNERN